MALTTTPCTAEHTMNRNEDVSAPTNTPCKCMNASAGTATESSREPWAKLAERLLRPLRVHGPDGKLAEGYAQWFGDAREGPPEVVTDNQTMRQGRRFPGPPNGFIPKSHEAAYNDPRGALF